MRVAATVEQLAALVRGRLVGDGSVPIRAARPVAHAGPGDITFIENERYAKMLRTSPASAAIVGPHINRVPVETSLAMIEVDDPILAFLAVRAHLGGEAKPRWSGVHALAWVAPTAQIGSDVAIYPFVYVGEDAVVGDGTTLYPGAVIGDRCQLGQGVIVHANAVLYPDVVLGDRAEIHAGTVLGGDGFGYRLMDGRHIKIPQTGRVEVGADVEIGANCTVDRATFEATRIGEGSKIDNLVMIGHNNQIGQHCMIAGRVGISGSCRIGNGVIVAGGAGIADHIRIGDGAVILAAAGVGGSRVAPGAIIAGMPAIPVDRFMEQLKHLYRLKRLYADVAALKAQVNLAGQAKGPS
jgi:UDP-3-O-[3-hydroxymyristoyl] glucosamine N-acyltransferase